MTKAEFITLFELFPTLFEADDNLNVFFKDKAISDSSMFIKFDTGAMEINMTSEGFPVQDIQFLGLYFGVDFEPMMGSATYKGHGVLRFNGYKDLGDDLCIKLFNLGIDIQYLQYKINEHGVACLNGYTSYDKTSIMRRDTIKNIITT